MKGFFSLQETTSTSRPDGKIYSCISCGAYKSCHSPKIEPQGTGKIMIIGAFPNSLDDKRGLLFQGKDGKMVQKVFDEFDIDIYKDCILTNALRCNLATTEATRNPTNYEIQCCRRFLLKSIQALKPKLIFLLGDEALYSLIGHRWKKDLDKIAKWRGWVIPDQDFKCWIAPIYDAKKVDACKGPEMYNIWKSDIANALAYFKKPFPEYIEPEIEYLEEDQLDILYTIKDDIAFDYETTGLKPQEEGHRIVCVSIADSLNHVYTFMMPKSRKKRKSFIDLMQNPKIGKIAQNMKFEDNWTNERLGCSVENWVWDTMLATHIMDNRSGISGLKFQAYVQFGIVDYDSSVNPYLKAPNEDSKNNKNRIMELLEKPGGQKLLLKYCAYDSVYEYRLAFLQRPVIELPF